MGAFSFFSKNKVQQALYPSRQSFFGKVLQLLKGKESLSPEQVEDLEAFLISADIGVETAFYFLDELKKNTGKDIITAFKEIARAVFYSHFDYGNNLPLLEKKQIYAILVVGVNGVGKTTSIAKLAHLYKNAGESVLIGAGDTFRAAAIEQLSEWAMRIDVPVIKRAPGADPSSVIYDTLSSGIAKEKSVLLLDTAGRLHTKTHLMEELSKIRRTIQKKIPDAPNETLLVIDASTGQNAIRQVEAFQEAAGVTGLVVTKLDGTAKGGILLQLAHRFSLPVRFIGVGEGIEDLLPFDPDIYLESLFSSEASK